VDWGRSQGCITMPTNQATAIETRINGMGRLTYARITNSARISSSSAGQQTLFV
jgi:hypothetical protein